MATSPPIDIRTLQAWEDAFEHPIPQVRLIHRQLQDELAVNREKLRGLVSESYRDLLQTADKIIEMDTIALDVENQLAEASRICNWRLLEKKARNVKNFVQIMSSRDQEKHAFIAQLAVLQGCPTAISKLLHQGGSSILAAKVFVMSRILQKSLSDKSLLKIVSSLKGQLAAIRSLLLQHIDHTLKTANLPAQSLIEALCSLSLVKTSPTADLLRHFLYIRSNAISSITEPGNLDTIAILNALKLFDRSLRETEVIFPRKISEALLQLKSKPLFHNAEFKAIPELNLDTNERWLPEDVRGFIPWVRHDELELNRIYEAVRSWASRELGILYTSIGHSLRNIDVLDTLAYLRNEVMGLLKGGNSQLVQMIMERESPRQKFRDLLNQRLGELLKLRTEELLSVAKTVKNLMGGIAASTKGSTYLWSQSIVNMAIANGASSLKSAIDAAVHGRDRSIKSFLLEYDQWSKCMTDTFDVIETIRSQGKSLNKFEDEDLDFDDEEDVQESNQDASKLEGLVVETVQSTYRDLEQNFAGTLNDLEAGSFEKHKDCTARAIFLLRAIREIRRRPPKLGNTIPNISWFGKALLKRLQIMISQGVSIQILLHFTKTLNRRRWGDHNLSQTLWEGNPPLPVQPSPIIFKFFHDLQKEMVVVGMDVWTPATVDNLKGVVLAGISNAYNTELNGRAPDNIHSPVKDTKANCETIHETTKDVEAGSEQVESTTENKQETTKDAEAGSEQVESTTENKQEGTEAERANNQALDMRTPPRLISESWAVQSIFDLFYLEKVLKGCTDDESTILRDHVLNLESLLNSSIEKDRMDANAQEYWKKTQLLFSLLVPPC